VDTVLRVRERIVRSLRWVGVLAASWLGLFVLVNVGILLAGAAARAAGKDPQLHDDGWPDITHLRRLDDKVLFGGQTTPTEYAELVDHGVTRVIDLRGHQRFDQAGRDDPAALAELGLEYVSLPISDGRAPTPAQIRRFVELVDEADGRVFAHCGGGVGRSTSMAAAYEASHGIDPSVLEQVAVGPPTIEQIWFVGTLRPGEPEHRISPVVAVVSRVADSPRTLWGHIESLT
jgi:protein tyrosine phosphatase (PTP) superfamily phosphohydrolase (DUF442 family)